MNIYEAIASVMKKGYAVGKDKKNTQQNFMYRGIDDVMNTFQPLLADAGIFIVPEVLDQKREERQTAKGGNLIYSVLKVKYTFYAEDGSCVCATVIGEGMDSGDKASNKAMAVAMKYAMFQVFCIPTAEMVDPDSECHDVKAKPSVPDEPALPDTAPDGYWYCKDCGQLIAGVTKKDGTRMMPKELVINGMKNFNKPLCADCYRKCHELNKNADRG